MEYQFRSHNLTGHRICLVVTLGVRRNAGRSGQQIKGESVLNKHLHVGYVSYRESQTVAVVSRLKDFK